MGGMTSSMEQSEGIHIGGNSAFICVICGLLGPTGRICVHLCDLWAFWVGGFAVFLSPSADSESLTIRKRAAAVGYRAMIPVIRAGGRRGYSGGFQMCLAIPMVLVEKDEFEGVAEVDGVRKKISLMFVPEAEKGEYVLVHAGFAIGQVDAEEAAKTLELLREYADAMVDL